MFSSGSGFLHTIWYNSVGGLMQSFGSRMMHFCKSALLQAAVKCAKLQRRKEMR